MLRHLHNGGKWNKTVCLIIAVTGNTPWWLDGKKVGWVRTPLLKELCLRLCYQFIISSMKHTVQIRLQDIIKCIRLQVLLTLVKLIHQTWWFAQFSGHVFLGIYCYLWMVINRESHRKERWQLGNEEAPVEGRQELGNSASQIREVLKDKSPWEKHSLLSCVLTDHEVGPYLPAMVLWRKSVFC